MTLGIEFESFGMSQFFILLKIDKDLIHQVGY